MELAAVDDVFPERDALSEVLAQLGERVAPITLARERTLPVVESLHGVFPDQGLVRGRVLSCRGAAASSVAFSVASAALMEGAWMAVVDVDTFGADAAAELGVPLERVVRVDSASGGSSSVSLSSSSVPSSALSPERQAAEWIDVMGAAVDGFDIVMTRVPASLRNERRPAAVRKLGSRVQQRGAVVLVLGDAGALGSDITLTTQQTVWSGLGQGFGHLRQRQINIEAAGRRQPNVRTCSLELLGAAGRVELNTTSSEVTPIGATLAVAGESALGRSDQLDAIDEVDPQAQVLAEMQAGLSDDHLAAG